MKIYEDWIRARLPEEILFIVKGSVYFNIVSVIFYSFENVV